MAGFRAAAAQFVPAALLFLLVACSGSNPVVETTVNQADLLGKWVRVVHGEHASATDAQGHPLLDTSVFAADTDTVKIVEITGDSMHFDIRSDDPCYTCVRHEYQLSGDSVTGPYFAGAGLGGYSRRTTVSFSGDTFVMVTASIQVGTGYSSTDEYVDKFVKYFGPLPPASWNMLPCPASGQ
jgi:hypothetical protein